MDLALTSSTMHGAGDYSTLVRSYNVLYAVTLDLDIVSGTYEIVNNTEDWVNFQVQYFYSATDVTGLMDINFAFATPSKHKASARY